MNCELIACQWKSQDMHARPYSKRSEVMLGSYSVLRFSVAVVVVHGVAGLGPAPVP